MGWLTVATTPCSIVSHRRVLRSRGKPGRNAEVRSGGDDAQLHVQDVVGGERASERTTSMLQFPDRSQITTM